ncbi:hypothetical protein MMA231_03062 [Asticcacaulis sp. MM231]|uniref:DUF3617 domain-containing protein n=1 Tax=Asticcacaulis sp. MM231 TaxID=3157666 RepID=UPI0032D5A347
MLQASLSRIALIAGLAATVAGCQKKPEPPAPVAPAPVVVAKPSQPLPARKPGLWETRLSEEGSPDAAQVLKICIDALTDQHLGILGTDLSGGSCSNKTYSPQGDNTWGLLAECAMGSGVVTEYSGSITGDYSRSYEMRVRSQTTGGNLPQMNRVTNYVVTSKRIGACTKEQKPGDIINDGVKMNLFDMSGIRRDGAASATAASDMAEPADVVD